MASVILVHKIVQVLAILYTEIILALKNNTWFILHLESIILHCKLKLKIWDSRLKTGDDFNVPKIL